MPQVSSYSAASAVTDDDTLYLIDGAVPKKVTAATLKTYAQAGLSVDPTVGGDLSGTASNAQIVANAVGAAEIASGAVGTSELADDAVTEPKINASGTPSSSTFLRGDMAWATPAGGGGTDESYQDHGNTGSTETVDYSVARTHRLVANANTVTVSFTGWPASGSKGQVELRLFNDDNSTARAWVLSPTPKTASGGGIPMPGVRATGTYSKVIVTTYDAGTTIEADLVGNDYA